jgi:chaperonin GroES
MAIRPLSDRIVIKVVEENEQTSGGIFIPDSAKQKPQKGEVISVGPGKCLDDGKREEMDVKVGEVVLYAKYSGTDVKINDEMFKILSVKDVLGVIE